MALWEMITDYGAEIEISVVSGQKEVDICIEGDLNTFNANDIDTLIAALTEARRAIS
tara:strand:+ start:1053 stop:1223 length:171 start_codon:yes stop_codon:yes gene_type:complete